MYGNGFDGGCVLGVESMHLLFKWERPSRFELEVLGHCCDGIFLKDFSVIHILGRKMKVME